MRLWSETLDACIDLFQNTLGEMAGLLPLPGGMFDLVNRFLSPAVVT